jgi:TolB protein
LRIRTLPVFVSLCVVAGITGCTFLGDRGPEFTNWEPVLSPDGKTLAYESPVNGSLELFTRDLATSEERRLTRNGVEDWSPSWAPEGSRLVFASSRDDNADVYLLDLETLEDVRLTTHEDDDINPSWGVDGRIYFNSNRSGAWEIYSIDPAGGNLLKITEVGE